MLNSRTSGGNTCDFRAYKRNMLDFFLHLFILVIKEHLAVHCQVHLLCYLLKTPLLEMLNYFRYHMLTLNSGRFNYLLKLIVIAPGIRCERIRHLRLPRKVCSVTLRRTRHLHPWGVQGHSTFSRAKMSARVRSGEAGQELRWNKSSFLREKLFCRYTEEKARTKEKCLNKYNKNLISVDYSWGLTRVDDKKIFLIRANNFYNIFSLFKVR